MDITSEEVDTPLAPSERNTQQTKDGQRAQPKR